MEKDIETIYVIDDKPRVSEALPSSLRAGGKNVRLFTSGAHFLSINRDNTAARLILDRQMPEPNGADVQRFVSTTIRIVFVSGTWRPQFGCKTDERRSERLPDQTC
jgi:FixJ family two-component response regulator